MPPAYNKAVAILNSRESRSIDYDARYDEPVARTNTCKGGIAGGRR